MNFADFIAVLKFLFSPPMLILFTAIGIATFFRRMSS